MLADVTQTSIIPVSQFLYTTANWIYNMIFIMDIYGIILIYSCDPFNASFPQSVISAWRMNYKDK